MPLRSRAYSVSVLAVAIIAVASSVDTFPVRQWDTTILLMVFTVVAVSFSFELPLTGYVSLSFAISIAAVMLGGPIVGVLVTVVGAVSIQDIREHKPVLTMLFNIGQLSLSALVAGLVFMGLGGQPLATASVETVRFWSQAIPAVAAALALHLINALFVGVYFSLKTELGLVEVWKQQNYAAHVVSFAFLALLGLVLAFILKVSGLLGALLLALPFVLARQTFLVYLMLANAYADTVRSLVAALEAKDVYTLGHSERVAAYASRIARRLGCSETAIQRIELAALMHDLGKIGIRERVLNKPGHLEADEYAEIKRHPDVGSELLKRVEFLADISECVRNHHERLDGSGYPDGLGGSDISLDARVLAVADSFDAMTSTRAYRAAMSTGAAMSELHSLGDVLLDRRAVNALQAEIDGVEGQLALLAGGDGDGHPKR